MPPSPHRDLEAELRAGAAAARPQAPADLNARVLAAVAASSADDRVIAMPPPRPRWTRSPLPALLAAAAAVLVAVLLVPDRTSSQPQPTPPTTPVVVPAITPVWQDPPPLLERALAQPTDPYRRELAALQADGEAIGRFLLQAVPVRSGPRADGG